jgi:hypothetical protein
MSNSIWWFLCLFTAVSAFHPLQTTQLKGRPCRDPAVLRHRRGRVFHLELSTHIVPSGFVNADTWTKAKYKGTNHYRDLLGSFSADLERLSDLRPPIPSADFSDTKTIISAGSSYTRLWTHSSWKRHATQVKSSSLSCTIACGRPHIAD